MMPNTLEVCKADLFTNAAELAERYPAALVDKVQRVRDLYNRYIADPFAKESELVDRIVAGYGVARSTAYTDLSVVKQLLPMLSTATKDFHRWRASEMLENTYRLALAKEDTRTMERAAASYAKLHRADEDDDRPLDLGPDHRQPFTATDDPSVLGIKPIPNIQAKIDAMLAKYRAETLDIEDVGYEDVDLEFDTLFPDSPEQS